MRNPPEGQEGPTATGGPCQRNWGEASAWEGAANKAAPAQCFHHRTRPNHTDRTGGLYGWQHPPLELCPDCGHWVHCSRLRPHVRCRHASNQKPLPACSTILNVIGDFLADSCQFEKFLLDEDVFGLFGNLPIHGCLLSKIVVPIHECACSCLGDIPAAFGQHMPKIGHRRSG